MTYLPLKDPAQKANRFLADKLRELRNDNDLTMREVADRLGTSHSFIGKVELQNRRVDVGEFILYCQAIDQDPVEVFKSLIEYHT